MRFSSSKSALFEDEPGRTRISSSKRACFEDENGKGVEPAILPAVKSAGQVHRRGGDDGRRFRAEAGSAQVHGDVAVLDGEACFLR